MKTGTGNRNGTQLIRSQQTKNQPKEEQKQQKPKLQKCPKKGGVKIGQSKQDENKWRCKTCKRLTDILIYECSFCGDPRYEKEQNIDEQSMPIKAENHD